jgi:Cytochrome c oxidase subunit IV
MAGEEVRLARETTEAPGELIHLPGPSYLPVVLAGGATIAVVGVVIWWPLVVMGGLVVLYSTVRWIGETRREISELPLEHH